MRLFFNYIAILLLFTLFRLNFSLDDGRPRVFTIRDSTDGLNCDRSIAWAGNGFKLPTNNQFELAARYIGPERSTEEPLRSEEIFLDGYYWTPGDYASGAYDNYENENENKNVAWYIVNSGGKTNPVKLKRANPLGLYDMTGNILEWCFDTYKDVNPDTIYTEIRRKTIRGAGFWNGNIFLRLSTITFQNSYDMSVGYGFRLVKNTK